MPVDLLRRRARLPLSLIAAALAGGSASALAAEEVPEMAPVVVTATRTDEKLDTVPVAVTVIDREQIAEQSKTATGLGEILGKLVPGMAVGSGTQTNFNQTIRGRAMLVLIDGVPQNTVRSVARDLLTIDPAMVERIEVVRGPTALYGHGGAGGVVNIITKAPGQGALTVSTEVGARSSLTKLDRDGLGGWLRPSLSGDHGKLDYSLGASIEHLPTSFDAHGDRIAPEPAQGDLQDTDALDLFGKLGWTGAQQRLQLTLNSYRARQDSDYVSDPSVNSAPPGTVSSRASKGLQLDDAPKTDNDMVNLSYRHDAVLGSELESQLYRRDYLTRFFPFDGRAVAGYSGKQVVASFLESSTWGGRLALDTPLRQGEVHPLSLLWGLDFASEDTEQRITVFDRATYDNSGGLRFEPVDERGWVPPIEHRQLGVFAQLEWQPATRWTLRGGARQEFIEVSVEDFNNLGSGAQVQGGDVDYDDIAYNAGATYAATEAISVYGNYAEGFSLPDVGLILRDAAADFKVSRTSLEPLEVKNYELGLRGHWKRVQGSLSAFYAKSDLGFFSAGLNNPVQRAPERTYGVEATADVQVNHSIRAGGSFTWLKGEYRDAQKGSTYVALNGFRVSPPKLTAYVEHETDGGWRNRLQGLYSGKRDDAFDEKPGNTGVTFGRWEVEDYLVFDWQSSKPLGPGRLALGIENLFNEDYHNVFSQLLYSGNVSHFKAPGRSLRLSYSWTF